MLSSKLFRRLLWLSQLLLLLIVPASVLSRPRAEIGKTEREARERLSGLSMPFLANSGQIDPSVAYYAPTFGGTVFVTRNGQIVYALPTAGPSRGRSRRRASASGAQTSDRRDGWSLTETPVGGRGLPRGSIPSPTGAGYFIGSDPSRWRSGLPTFEEVSLGEVWPGVSLDLRARGRTVEKLFTIRPQGDASRIRMSIEGALSLRTDAGGALIASTGLGDVRMTRPVAYQEHGGARVQVEAAYELHGRDYGFRLGGHDSSSPVVIDPIVQATYLGGSGLDSDGGLAVPASGEVYVAGFTTSSNFPGTAGGWQTSNGGGTDVFVARLNAALTTLNQATYLGGSGDDRALALAIAASGDVFVAGDTTSSNFPGTAGGAQTSYGGGAEDGFVARLNAALTNLNQATYLGGSGVDGASALTIAASGEVYVAGFTASSNFPGTAGGWQTSNSGGSDAFVARLNAALTALNQATYLGGSGGDFAQALAIRTSGTGEVFVAGSTASGDFPGTAGGYQTSNGGGIRDGFIARLNLALTTLNQSTYLGSSGDEEVSAIVLPASGEVYVSGQTTSGGFPGTAGGAQPFNAGGYDGFVARLNLALTALSQATYFGGSNDEILNTLAIPASGEVFVAGETSSTNLPGTAGGAQPVFGGGPRDAFIARLDATLTTLNQSTYLGGSGDEFCRALAISTSGDVYVAGLTGSSNFPGTLGGAQPAFGGGAHDAYVARLTPHLAAAVDVTGLGPARVWLGLKSNDDAGTMFDVLAEALRNGSAIGSGEVDGIPGDGSGFHNAVLTAIAMALSGPASFAPGDSLGFRLSVRIAASSGRRKGTARLWYNDSEANSRFDIELDGVPRTYFLRDGFELGTAPGPGPKRTAHVVADRNDGNAFRSFGTWSVALP